MIRVEKGTQARVFPGPDGAALPVQQGCGLNAAQWLPKKVGFLVVAVVALSVADRKWVLTMASVWMHMSQDVMFLLMEAGTGSY